MRGLPATTCRAWPTSVPHTVRRCCVLSPGGFRQHPCTHALRPTGARSKGRGAVTTHGQSRAGPRGPSKGLELYTRGSGSPSGSPTRMRDRGEHPTTRTLRHDPVTWLATPTSLMTQASHPYARCSRVYLPALPPLGTWSWNLGGSGIFGVCLIDLHHFMDPVH